MCRVTGQDGDSAGPLVAPEARALLGVLRAAGPLTRAQLAERTGLARTTLTVRLETLLHAGLVVPAGGAASRGGRPPGLLAFRADARLLLGIDLGATHAVVGLTDLTGTVVATRAERLAVADGPRTVLGRVSALARTLVEGGSGRPWADVVGIGVGLPGPVEHSTGRPVRPPIMPGWDGFDVPALLRDELGVPLVLVDNDVNLLALGEHTSAWSATDDLLFVKVATGIGAGIVAGGRLQRGAQGSAGDLGHVRVPFTRDAPPHGDADADLEALASGPAVAAALRDQGVPARDADDVVDLAQRGLPEAVRAVRQAGRDLGAVLATVVNLLNPGVIVVGGTLAGAGEHLLAGVRETVYGRSTALATRDLTIVPATSGEAGGVLGAAVMVSQHVLDGPAEA
ncbi:ROK family protein [Luteimicrobium sp. DT211]|uniref:ROK family transcriptional regulator n=1 Tax=Luteimicrobium sp. DT211 TaxID=3393412 RepID=UPI003CEB0AC0